jgi:hypothetical protein
VSLFKISDKIGIITTCLKNSMCYNLSQIIDTNQLCSFIRICQGNENKWRTISPQLLNSIPSIRLCDFIPWQNLNCLMKYRTLKNYLVGSRRLNQLRWQLIMQSNYNTSFLKEYSGKLITKISTWYFELKLR